MYKYLIFNTCPYKAVLIIEKGRLCVALFGLVSVSMLLS